MLFIYFLILLFSIIKWQNVIAWRHLIGFFIFLALTIYTAMKIPKVVDLNSLQHFPDMLKKADLHKLQSEILTCLPSMPDLHRLRDEISSWHIKEYLYNCLPVRFSSSNHTDACVLVIALLLNTCFISLFSFVAGETVRC